MDNVEIINNGKTFKSGRYIPKYPEKYLGDVNNIIFRSSWELSAFKFLDRNTNFLKWGSEIIPIKYFKPIITPSGPSVRVATYYPDLFVIYKDRNGNIIKELIEIKPFKQTKPSKSKKFNRKLEENYIFSVNSAKWNAAHAWCKKYNVKFSIVTEKDLFRS